MPLLTLHDDALAGGTFRKLLRRVRALGSERLPETYQTTFWFDLGEPTSVAEEAILELARLLPHRRGVRGAEWWLSRMRTTDVQVDFHQDRDEILACSGGALVHPIFSSILYLNRSKGGLLAVTEEPAVEANPARAPLPLDADLARPLPNRYVHFRGDLLHGVLDAKNDIPHGRLPGPSRLRLALVVNYWRTRPTDVPTFAASRHYRSLAVSPARSSR